jgi:hypothetical protein
MLGAQLSSPAPWARAVATSSSWSWARSMVLTASARMRGGRVCSTGVGADPVGVEPGDLGRDADAVQGHRVGPGVAGDLGGEVAGEVVAVGGVSGQGDREVLAVEQPHVAGVAGADGDEQRVGGDLVGDEVPEDCGVGAGRQRPAGLVPEVGPRWASCLGRAGAGSGRGGRARRRPRRAWAARRGPGRRRGGAGPRRRTRRRAAWWSRRWPRSSRPGPGPAAGWRRCGRGGGGAPAWRGVAAAGSTSTRPGPDRRPGRRAATAPGSRRCRLGWWLWRRGSGRRLEWGRGWWRRRSSVSVWRTRCPKRRRCWGPRTTTGRGPPACSRSQVCRGLRPPVHRWGALPSASAQAWRFPGWWRWCRGWSGATPGRSGQGRAGAARRAAADVAGGLDDVWVPVCVAEVVVRDLAEGVPGLDGVGLPVLGWLRGGRCGGGEGSGRCRGG